MVILIAHVFVLRAYFSGIFQSQIFLWSNSPVFLTLGIVFAIDVDLLSLIYLSFLLIRSGLDGIWRFEVFVFKFSTTVVSATIWYCYGNMAFHLTGASRTSYFLRASVISCLGGFLIRHHRGLYLSLCNRNILCPRYILSLKQIGNRVIYDLTYCL